MKKFLFVVFCLTAGIASAQDSDETAAAEDDQVDLYISVIENIDVTAEKPLVDTDDDADLDAILDEAEALENEEAEE